MIKIVRSELEEQRMFRHVRANGGGHCYSAGREAEDRLKHQIIPGRRETFERFCERRDSLLASSFLARFPPPQWYSGILPQNPFPGRVRDMRQGGPMDRTDGIYGKNLHEIDLAGLAELCGNVVNNHSSDQRQADTAHGLRAEWVRLEVRFRDDKRETEEALLRKRMLEFLVGVPAWMLAGI
jgi:hypothetical protein